MNDALVFESVVKVFGRGVRALDSLSFVVPRGSITGFVGPNGAGKTTTFSVISGFLGADSGTIRILDQPRFDAVELRGRLGVLPQDAELSQRHTPRELLRHLSQLQGMSRREADIETDRVLEQVSLTDRRDTRIAGLSHGMRRRVAVGSALLGSPELVLLDEPMAGLDPILARSLRETLSSIGGGQTLVVSSHALDELERLCDHVVMIDKGRCLRQGPIGAVTGKGERAEWTIVGTPPLEALAAALPGHRFMFDNGVLVETAPVGSDLDASSMAVMAVLAAEGRGLIEMRRGLGLERQFFADAERVS